MLDEFDDLLRMCEVVEWERFQAPHLFQGGGALTSRQVRLKRTYSGKRCRTEHDFGSMHTEMPEMVMRCIGSVRRHAWIGLRSLSYNMKRFGALERQTVS